MQKLRICFIAIDSLGLPAVNGGATQTLLDSIAKKNKEKQLCDLTFVAQYVPEAARLAVEDEYTHYRYLQPAPWMKRAFRLGRPFRKIWNAEDYLWQRMVSQCLQQEEFDAIIVESGPGRGLYRHWKKRFHTKVFLLHLHALPNFKKTKSIYTGYFAISPYTQRKASQYVDKKKVFLWNNCIDTEKFVRSLTREQKDKLRRKLGVENVFVFLFCGRTIQEKGIRELILAFLQMKERKKAALLIAGNSNFACEVFLNYDTEIKELSAKDKNIKILGYVPNEKLYQLHSIADCVSVPSLFEEPQGLVVLEGMCAGNAMLVSDAGAIPDYVSGDCGIIVKRGKNFVADLSQAMDFLVQHPDACKEMGENARRKGVLYNEEKYYTDFLEGVKYFVNHREFGRFCAGQCDRYSL